MAKKIRFPLEMENQVEVRSMEELREHFSLSKVLEYVKNGKLEIWLRDRYENELVGKVAELDKEDEELPKKVSEIFEVPYDESLEEDLRKAEERAERIKKLKEFTEEEGFISEIDKVAFDQDELYDLLDEKVKEIYLCGDRFSIPLSVEGITYRGVNEPIVVIDSKEIVDWDSKKIRLENVRFDEKYQAIVNNIRTKRKRKESYLGNAPLNTFLSFLLSNSEQEKSRRMYELARKEIRNFNYNPDKDIMEMIKLIHNNNLIGLGERFISML